MKANTLQCGRAGSSRARTPFIRLRVWWHQFALDRKLAAGVDPGSSVLLEARARQLSTRKSRARLVAGIRQAERHSHMGGVHTASASPDGVRIRRSSASLLLLAERIEADAPVGVQGLAITWELLTDGSSPLYRGGSGEDLDDVLAAAHRGLDRWT